MGMFDYVDYRGPCPECGDELVGWQSKDGECVLSILTPQQARNFYTICLTCGAWVDADSGEVIDVSNPVNGAISRCDVLV